MNFIRHIAATLIFLATYYTTSIHPLLKNAADPDHRFHFESQGQTVNMSYLYRKNADARETVLLLHGKNFSSAYWKSTADHLFEKGYSVIAPEQLGFGGSSQPENYQYSFQQLAINTKLLLDSLKIRNVIVLGHSMGGMLAVRFALMYPEACNRLILEDPIGLEDWKIKVPYGSVDEEYSNELKKTRADLKKYMQENYFHNDWKPEYESLLDENENYHRRDNFKAYAKNMALTSDMIFTQPVVYEFPFISVRTVLIIGQKDKTAIGREKADAKTAAELGNYPKLGKEAAARIRKCKLIALEGLGHVPHVEDFKAFSRALDRALTD